MTHSEPPIVEGLGTAYTRTKRWKLSDTGRSYELGFSGGDEAEYSVEDLFGFIQTALALFVDVFGSVVQFYIDLIEKNGVKLVRENGKVRLQI